MPSTLYIGLHVPDPARPDWIPLEVTNALLGCAFGSRITTSIREQKGYTYSPFGCIAPHSRDAYWAEVADVTTGVTTGVTGGDPLSPSPLVRCAPARGGYAGRPDTTRPGARSHFSRPVLQTAAPLCDTFQREGQSSR